MVEWDKMGKHLSTELGYFKKKILAHSHPSILMSSFSFYLCNLLIFEVLHWKQSHLAFNDCFHNLEYDHLGHLPHVDMKYCTSEAYRRTKHKCSSLMVLKRGGLNVCL